MLQEILEKWKNGRDDGGEINEWNGSSREVYLLGAFLDHYSEYHDIIYSGVILISLRSQCRPIPLEYVCVSHSSRISDNVLQGINYSH